MKLQALLIGATLSVVAAGTAAGDENTGASPGQGPLAGTGGNTATPVTKKLNSKRDDWTSEHYRKAKPKPFPAVDQTLTQTMLDESTDNPQPQDSTQDQPGVSTPGHPPSLEKPALERLEKRLYVPDESRSDAAEPDANTAGSIGSPAQQAAQNAAVPLDVGFRRAYFSSQALAPLEADREYPYSTTGRLFFRIPNEGLFACSGSVISLRLILTAGHCVHSGSGNENGWFTDFEFVPAYRDGVAPFSTWKGSAAFVTTPWYVGNGTVPNVADYALIEVEDQTVDGVPRKIGEIVGYLGFQTNRLLPNHAHLLGYPAAFDNGERMHQVTAQSFRKYDNNTALYGADMTEGSSGGPWIMNFGPAASGQTGNAEPTRNLVIGATSYGFTSPPLSILGSSTLDGNFTSMLSAACSSRPGNCP